MPNNMCLSTVPGLCLESLFSYQDRETIDLSDSSFGGDLLVFEKLPVASSKKQKRERFSKRWAAKDDKKLTQLVAKYGVGNWFQVAKRFEGRSAQRLRERYVDHLRPGINKDPLTEMEKDLILSFQAARGNKWTELNERMPDRTVLQIKNFWYRFQRKNKGSD